jgi:molecular chaperone DnaK
MPPLIGIDLGTTNSCLAFLTGGRPKVIPNLEGALLTPSMVGFGPDGEVFAGPAARRQAAANSARTVFAVKRLIGRKFEALEIQAMARRLPFPLVSAPNGDVAVEIGGRTLSPEEISAHVLGYLKVCAEAHLGIPLREAVITVPAHFGDPQRQATKDAAEVAGLSIVRVINEPTAASLAFGLHENSSGKVAVIDLGGGTFDVTILEIAGGVFEVLATNGETDLGGEDFDARVTDWLVDRLPGGRPQSALSDPTTLFRIKEAAERAKCELSFTTRTDIYLPFLAETDHLAAMLSRAELESLTVDLVEKMIPVIGRTLAEAGLAPDRIDHVLLIGGQTRMPFLRQRMAEYFGRPAVEGVDPDVAVAEGAAIQAGILKGDAGDIILLLDVTTAALGIEIEGDGFEKLIDKNTTIPTKKTRAFTTVDNNQRQVRIHVLQGDEKRASLNTSLAVFDLTGIPPAPAGIPQIDVTFEIDADGMVQVRARDVRSGLEQSIEVHPSSGLTEREIDELGRKRREMKDQGGRGRG